MSQLTKRPRPGLMAIAATLAVLVTIGLSAPAKAEACDEAKAAVANTARPEEDRARDPGRRPSDVLCFFGIQKDMHVLDLFSGSGYYSEILSHLVAENGKVTAHNNAAYLAFAKEQIDSRYGDDRLKNVIMLEAGSQ